MPYYPARPMCSGRIAALGGMCKLPSCWLTIEKREITLETAASDGLLVVGASGTDDRGSSSGSAYVFEESNSTGLFVQVSKLLPDDGESSDHFGVSVATSDALVMVGAFLGGDNVSNSGSVYIFEKNSTGAYVQVSKLLGDDGQLGDNFGESVAAGDGLLVVGAPGFGDNALSPGSAYVFT
eukprot:m.16093 g.16093  ORF g.16093 m.16093 type:complete len:181 (-) comp10542_c0_seq1:2112-2654(-)